MWGSSVSVSVQQCWSAFFSICAAVLFSIFSFHTHTMPHASTYVGTCWHVCMHSHKHTHTRTCAWTECLTALWPASQWTIIIFLRGSHWTDCQLSTFQRLKSSAQWKCEWSFYLIFLPYFTVNTTFLNLFRSGSSTFRVQREIKLRLPHSLFL